MSTAERIFIMPINAVTIGTAVQDIFALLAGANRGFQIHRIHLDASGVTAPAEVNMRLKRGTATVTLGSGGTTPAIGKANSTSNSKATTVTGHANDTTQATTSGAFTALADFNWQVLTPFDEIPAPEDRWEADSAEALILDLPAVLGSTVTVTGFIAWSEGLVAG